MTQSLVWCLDHFLFMSKPLLATKKGKPQVKKSSNFLLFFAVLDFVFCFSLLFLTEVKLGMTFGKFAHMNLSRNFVGCCIQITVANYITTPKKISRSLVCCSLPFLIGHFRCSLWFCNEGKFGDELNGIFGGRFVQTSLAQQIVIPK